MKLALTIIALLALTCCWLSHNSAAVPCDAQAGQMQPRKLTLEQRVERLEKRIEDHERRLTPTPAEAEK